MMTRTLHAFAMLGALLSPACDSGSIPDVAGRYTRTSVGPVCAASFDTELKVLQSGSNLILRAVNPGFTDATGTIDIDGAFVVSGSFKDGSRFQCAGSFIGATASASCWSGDVACNVSYRRL